MHALPGTTHEEARMIELPKVLPGWSEEQTDGFRLFAEVLIHNSIEEYESKVRDGGCRVECERMDRVETWAFGDSTREIDGADTRLDDVEKFIAGVNRLKWLVIAAVVAGVGSIITSLVMLAASLAAKG
jgi:hypothetical protein